MDAKKVLAVLKDVSIGHFGFDQCPSCGYLMRYGQDHKEDCKLAALMLEAEHEAASGGWKPGTEPPSHHRFVAAETSARPGLVSIAWCADYGEWKSHNGATLAFVDRWHELPPLPEEQEQAARAKGEGQTA